VTGRQRILWQVILWYVLTLGIYRRIWLYKVNKEVDGHAGLGFNHRTTLWLLLLPFIGPSIVTWHTANRINSYLYTDKDLQYGPTWGLWAATLIPILGNGAFLGWTQTRLNHFWIAEKSNQKLAIDITHGLDNDPAFKARLTRARSEKAGARANERPSMRDVKAERERVRALGGTTPINPWKRPKGEALRHMHIECGECFTNFEVQRNPFEPTPIVCTKCGTTDILPSLRGESRAPPEGALVPTLKATCPQCSTKFYAVRDLDADTHIVCPKCAHHGVVPKPKAKATA
jgi:DNA-directed RNA polymerase subunit RPC12/RpoP